MKMTQTHKEKQHVTIKGTRSGLTLIIDDRCSFNEAFAEIQQKVSQNTETKEDKAVRVTIQLGNRYLTEDDKEQFRSLLEDEYGLHIEAFDSLVIQRKEALKWKEETDIKTISRVIRSGQVVHVTGDLLLLGDVNPGGQVQATGNIYILGNLYGIAHAGFNGDQEAVVIASYMKPSQLRIASLISRAPDYETDGILTGCGIVSPTEGKIVIETMQTIARMRRKLDGFERRMLNG